MSLVFVLEEVQDPKTASQRKQQHSARAGPPFAALQVGSHGQVLEAQKLDVLILPVQLRNLCFGCEYAHKWDVTPVSFPGKFI